MTKICHFKSGLIYLYCETSQITYTVPGLRFKIRAPLIVCKDNRNNLSSFQKAFYVVITITCSLKYFNI